MGVFDHALSIPIIFRLVKWLEKKKSKSTDGSTANCQIDFCSVAEVKRFPADNKTRADISRMMIY
jgi:hypothetical protein